MARADWLFGTGTLEGLERAIRIEPSDGAILALAAEYRDNRGETSPEIDRQLRQAARLNPLDSSILMTLGIRAEFQGNTEAAERYLVHATELDHQFKPAWTLANFYLRNGRPDDRAKRMWPLIRRCLKLDPLGFDPEPVFDLCWYLTGDSKRILEVMPRPRLLGYLTYLMKTGKTDSALEVWPGALAAMDPATPGDTAAMRKFTDSLAAAGRIDEAVQTWNQLIGRGIVQSGRLDPSAGVSIADPTFKYPVARPFGWDLAAVNGVFFSAVSPSLRVELDGNEPESFRMLSVLAPVVPARKYRLTWKADSTGLSSPQDPGILFQVLPEAGKDGVAACAPLLATGGSGSCAFENPEGRHKIRIALIYRRASGTTRIQGTLRLQDVHLEFGS